jgi:hypothetical protein
MFQANLNHIWSTFQARLGHFWSTFHIKQATYLTTSSRASMQTSSIFENVLQMCVLGVL